MFGIGMTELMIILVIVLVVFGARKLPEIGSGLGKGIKSFKSGMSGKEEDQEDPSLIKEKPTEEGEEAKKS
jgi:sec-independent protein translocase protein TatA